MRHRLSRAAHEWFVPARGVIAGHLEWIHKQVYVAGVEEAGAALLEYVLRGVECFETGAGRSVRAAGFQAETSDRATFWPTKRCGRDLDEDRR